MLERFHSLAANRQTFIVLLIGAVAFLLLGNLGGKDGNPSWLLAPVCLLLMLLLGIDAFIQSRRKHPNGN